MKTSCVATVAILFTAVSSSVPATGQPKGDGLNALEKKLLGAWIGQGGCDGRIVFQADGTYHVMDWTVGGISGTGTWKIEWSALPPTLVLSPTQLEFDEEAKPTKVYLRTLNDKELKFIPNGAQHGEYLRGTEAQDVRIRISLLDRAVRQYAESNGKLPANLKTLVDAKIISSKLLADPWGKEFRYDVPGKKNRSRDIWTETPDKKVIGSWFE